jgi:transposase
MSADDRRSYGLGDSMPFIRGIPRVVKQTPVDMPPCPHCGCKTTYVIEVDVEMPLLRGGKGKGTYIGCPACPFASPMVSVGVGGPDLPTLL